MINKTGLEFLSDSEFKLFANLKTYHENKAGIANLPFNGDGFTSTEERFIGYKNLKNQGLIHFDESKFKPRDHIPYPDVTIL